MGEKKKKAKLRVLAALAVVLLVSGCSTETDEAGGPGRSGEEPPETVEPEDVPSEPGAGPEHAGLDAASGPERRAKQCAATATVAAFLTFQSLGAVAIQSTEPSSLQESLDASAALAAAMVELTDFFPEPTRPAIDQLRDASRNSIERAARISSPEELDSVVSALGRDLEPIGDTLNSYFEAECSPLEDPACQDAGELAADEIPGAPNSREWYADSVRLAADHVVDAGCVAAFAAASPDEEAVPLLDVQLRDLPESERRGFEEQLDASGALEAFALDEGAKCYQLQVTGWDLDGNADLFVNYQPEAIDWSGEPCGGDAHGSFFALRSGRVAVSASACGECDAGVAGSATASYSHYRDAVAGQPALEATLGNTEQGWYIEATRLATMP
jgi:hypothetical protein